MKHGCVHSAIFFLLSIPAISAQTQNPPSSMPREPQVTRITAQVPAPAEPLRITFGSKSATWTPATLAALPHKSVTVHSERLNADVAYSGVPIMDLLMQVGVPAKPHGKDFRLYLVFVGSDGYEVVFSMGELTPYLHDAPVIVADAENGKALISDGPFKLVATGDKQPERWVRNLVAIRVLTAE